MVTTSIRRAVILAATASTLLNGAVAFAPTQPVTKSVVPLQMSAVNEAERTSYGEESRKFRRTVYTHDEWVKHRSPNRFVRNLSSFTNSGIYKNIGREVFATTSVATFICAWNIIFGDYQDISGAVHAGPLKDSIIPILALPLAPFTLSSPSLGLLLGKYAEIKIPMDS